MANDSIESPEIPVLPKPNNTEYTSNDQSDVQKYKNNKLVRSSINFQSENNINKLFNLDLKSTNHRYKRNQKVANTF